MFAVDDIIIVLSSKYTVFWSKEVRTMRNTFETETSESGTKKFYNKMSSFLIFEIPIKVT